MGDWRHVFGECVLSLRGFNPKTRARTESQEEESGSVPFFMKPAQLTESPSPQMTFSPSSSHSSSSISSFFYSSSLSFLFPLFLRSFLFPFFPPASSIPLFPCHAEEWYTVVSLVTLTLPAGSLYLDNPHPLFFMSLPQIN